jgi:branched-subunit amino acid ABC-type transport system permease component
LALGLQLTLNGLTFGGLVFLLAAGLSVILGLMACSTWRTAASTC